MSSQSDSDCWAEFRRQMPVTKKWAYFDHAAVAPISGPARSAMMEWADDIAENGDAYWGQWRKRVEEVRKLSARFVRAATSEIALIRNTTEGVNIVAEGIDWREGDNVVFPVTDYPTNRLPWLNLEDRGVEIRQIGEGSEQFDVSEVEAACDQRTRVVAVSWVGYATGWRNDIEAIADIAHKCGGLCFVDAIQGLGTLPLNLGDSSIDFLSADGHKWLLGPEGAGVFFARKGILPHLRPLGLGWNSVQKSGDFTDPSPKLKSTASRYEGGSYNMCGLHGFGASLQFIDGYGIDAVSGRLREVTDRLCDKLKGIGAVIASSRDDMRWSGIVAFELPGKQLQPILARCLEAGVVLNLRAGRLRASPHVYTDDDDIDRLVEALRQA